ncbi:MAG: hypothetical protein HYZ71_12040 [Deltaproteobacteria bacterium]|nr:hypothetical protein [Deltaproteobacteria bacterium]
MSEGGHTTGNSAETDAIINNMISDQKNQPSLPSAESMGVGGPKVTDFEVKTPEIKGGPPAKQMVQMTVPDPNQFNPKKQMPANAGGGGC